MIISRAQSGAVSVKFKLKANELFRLPHRRQINCYRFHVMVEGAVPFFGSMMSPKAQREESMAWTTPVLIEICIGLEINGYLPPEF